MQSGHLGLHSIDRLRHELDDLAAARADQVLMMRARGTRLVALEARVEVMLSNEPRLAHEIERAIYGRFPYRTASCAKPRQDLFRGDVMVSSEQHLGNSHPLRSHRMTAATEVVPEAVESSLARDAGRQLDPPAGRICSTRVTT
jgi:hypothetical protein